MATTKTKKRTVNYERIADAAKATALEAIDEQLESINEKMRKYEPLIEAKKSLEASKRSLLGGARLTSGNNGMRLRQEDLVLYLKENPGLKVQEIAEHFGTPYSTVGSHLLRGRDERFLQTASKRWYVRDPEEGIDTVDDIEEDE